MSTHGTRPAAAAVSARCRPSELLLMAGGERLPRAAWCPTLGCPSKFVDRCLQRFARVGASYRSVTIGWRGTALEYHDQAARAIDDLAGRHGVWFLRLAYQLTHDRHAAEDLLQDALLACYQAWARGETPADDPARFAYVRIALTRRSVKSKHFWSHHLPLNGGHHAPTGLDDNNDSRTTRLVVWQAFGRLKKRERAAVVLHYYLDLPHAEVAAQLGCRAGTARSLCSRGLAQLRDALITHEDETPNAAGANVTGKEYDAKFNPRP